MTILYTLRISTIVPSSMVFFIWMTCLFRLLIRWRLKISRESSVVSLKWRILVKPRKFMEWKSRGIKHKVWWVWIRVFTWKSLELVMQNCEDPFASHFKLSVTQCPLSTEKRATWPRFLMLMWLVFLCMLWCVLDRISHKPWAQWVVTYTSEEVILVCNWKNPNVSSRYYGFCHKAWTLKALLELCCSDYAGVLDKRRSTTGMCLQLLMV